MNGLPQPITLPYISPKKMSITPTIIGSTIDTTTVGMGVLCPIFGRAPVSVIKVCSEAVRFGGGR